MRQQGRFLDMQINVHSTRLGARFEELLDLLDVRAQHGNIELTPKGNSHLFP